MIFLDYVHTGCGLYGVWSEANNKLSSVRVKKCPMDSVDINLNWRCEPDAQLCRPGQPRVSHQLGAGAEALPIWYEIAGMIAKRRLVAGAQCGRGPEVCHLHCGGPEGVWQGGRSGTVTEARHYHAPFRSHMVEVELDHSCRARISVEMTKYRE